MQQLCTAKKAFSTIGGSRETGWMGEGVYPEQPEAARRKGWWRNGNGQGELKMSNREVLIPGPSSVHTRPRNTA